MATKTTIKGLEVYTISSENGHTRASFVPEKGGFGSSIIMPHDEKARELLFIDEKHFWQKDTDNTCYPGGWPFLFPICGRLERLNKAGTYIYDSHIYQLPIHGFATMLPWQVFQDDADTLGMELTENKDMLAIYPFQFKVQLIYKVKDRQLICEQIYSNNSDKPMVYYAGFHPYFLTPDPSQGKEKVMLNFTPKRFLRYNDQLTDLVGEQHGFDLPISVADPSVSEQITEVTDNVAHLAYPDGFNLHLKTTFRYLQFYSNPDKPYICVEPWMAFPNAMNTCKGGMVLAPGESESYVLELSGC